ncbi:hypothetical protein PVC01_000109800 [Plasmodium vivax]|uniref:VIR protein n=1 Tax=Plasmodium vivax TaxID=5855 RepID=A0A1G4EBF8_PLAVI|nr:hypothetical protein PVC01_000109800 [Plasmodium vivax]
MAKPLSDEVYLKYDDYIKLKDKFSNNRQDSSSTTILDQLLHDANIQIPKNSDSYKTYSKLLRHIHDDHVFFWGEQIDACKYIRYMLQKEVEVNLGQSYDSNVVKNFQKFLTKYAEKFPHVKNRCISKIEPIETTTFYKMHTLYKLYDEYTPYSRYVKSNVQYFCRDFHAFVNLYNIYITDNESQSELFNIILENFSKNLNKTVLNYKEECEKKNYYYHLRNPKLHIQTPVHEIETPIHAHEGQTELSSVNTKLQGSSHEVLGTSHTKLHQEVTESPPIQEETTRVQTLTEVDNYRETSNNHAMHNHRTETVAKRVISPGYELTRAGFDSLGRKSYPIHQELSNDAERDSSTILGSIIGVLKDVEPAPILGVSGGMGALFLLFKYTPVGTFFRGRRGRTYGIPSGFNGPFPGEFPGYQDYLGGNIGYSQMSHLAE